MSQNDIRLHIFVFLLRVTLLIITIIALHDADSAAVLARCPLLWEFTLTILCVKCLRLTLCPMVFRTLRIKFMDIANAALHTVFLIVEVVLTSQSLNSTECMRAASLSSGYPVLIFTSFALCVHDGAYVLSHALFGIMNRL